MKIEITLEQASILKLALHNEKEVFITIHTQTV